MNPAPDADVCSATDGVCIDKANCPSDPDCASSNNPPPSGCTPNPLPAFPTNLLANTPGVWQTDRVALADRVYFTAFENDAPSQTKIYTCSTSGCDASPPHFGAGLAPYESFLAAFGGHVYWSAVGDSIASNPNVVYRANPDGSAADEVISVNDGAGQWGRVGGRVGVYDDYGLVVDTSAPQQSDAGLRVIGDSFVSPPLPGLSTPPYSITAVTGNDQYMIYYADPITAQPAPYDAKIHVFDLDGFHVGSTPMSFSTVYNPTIVGNSLLFTTNIGLLQACTLPACNDVVDVGSAVKFRGATFAVANGRVYFPSIADQGCNQGPTGVLASCDAASLIAGTCTPTVHSTSIHWINLRSLAVDGTHAVMTSRTSVGAVYSAPL